MLENTRLMYVYLPLTFNSKIRNMYLILCKEKCVKNEKYVTTEFNNICILRMWRKICEVFEVYNY